MTTYKRLPNNLPHLLRKHGLKVVEVDGWRHRGRPESRFSFYPVGVLCHDTVTPKSLSDDAVLNLLVDGRPGLPGPLCQIGLGRDGTVYLVASGRANHAGRAKSVGTVASGDGNTLYIGIEAFNDGVGEPWTEEQYTAYYILAAALSVEVTHNSYRTVNGHKETSTEGKVDPTFDMRVFRQHVHAKMVEMKHPKKTSRGPKVEEAINALKAAKGHGKRGRGIASALKTLIGIKPIF